jgi:hypothetical protein
LFALRNSPGLFGSTSFAGSPQQLTTGVPNTGVPLTGPLSRWQTAKSTTLLLAGILVPGLVNFVTNADSDDSEWRKSIDVNGDGRLDLIVADESTQGWVVYLNTPDPRCRKSPASDHNLRLGSRNAGLHQRTDRSPTQIGRGEARGRAGRGWLGIQRLVRAATGSEPIRKALEVHLINLVEDGHRGLLNDFVLQRRDA